MLTKNDLSEIRKEVNKAISDNNQKLFKVLATKQELNDLRNEFVTKKEFYETTDKQMSLLDKIYDIVKRMDEEMTSSNARLDNHKVRISRLESAVIQ